jgi:hypothetical protein
MQLVWTENADSFCDDDHSQPKKKVTDTLGKDIRDRHQRFGAFSGKRGVAISDPK